MIREELSVGAWVARAVTRELQREQNEDINDNDEELILPQPGVKPRGLQNRIKLGGRGTMSVAVIEDRR